MKMRKSAVWVLALILLLAAISLVANVFFAPGPREDVTGSGFVFVQAKDSSAQFKAEIEEGAPVQVYAEIWRGGQCEKSEQYLTVTSDTENFSVLMTPRRSDKGDGYVGVDVQTGTDKNTDVVYFELNENTRATGWVFNSYEEGERAYVRRDADTVLAALVFDMGSGVRVFDCKTLTDEPERLENASCTVLVRARMLPREEVKDLA